MLQMSDKLKDDSLDWTISNLVSDYLCPSFPIFRIKFLYSESYSIELQDKDGPTGDYVGRLQQKITENLFQIIPDNFLDKHIKTDVKNFIYCKKSRYIYSNNSLISMILHNKISESFFIDWIRKKILLGNNVSYFYLDHIEIYSCNKIYNVIKEQQSLKKNVIECVLKNNKLKTQNNSFYRITFEVFYYIDKNKGNTYFCKENGNCILETIKQDIIFESNINKDKTNFTWLKKACLNENLKNTNTNKIIESDPISYFLDSVEKLKISLHFLLYLKNVMLIEYDDREIKIKELIRLV